MRHIPLATARARLTMLVGIDVLSSSRAREGGGGLSASPPLTSTLPLVPSSQRLSKWFTTPSPKDKAKVVKDVTQLVLSRIQRRAPHSWQAPTFFPTPTPRRHQSRISPLCLALLHRGRGRGRQRAHHAGDRAPLCRADGQALWQRVRARHHL